MAPYLDSSVASHLLSFGPFHFQRESETISSLCPFTSPIKSHLLPHSPHSYKEGVCVLSLLEVFWGCPVYNDFYIFSLVNMFIYCSFISANLQKTENFPNFYLDLRKEKENYSSHVVLFHIKNKGDSSSSNSLVNQTALVTAQAGHKPHTSLNTGNVEELRVITKIGELRDWPVRSQKKYTEGQSSRRKEQDPGGPSQGIFPSCRRMREQALAL